ncbi:MAG: metal ABC transporter substrate-binding protein [Dehalococcoidia bacterium]
MTRRPRPLLVLAILAFPALLALLALLASCGTDGAAGGDAAAGVTPDDRPRVVTTFPLLSELAVRIGGDRLEVITLIPIGVDEHSYQPSPEVAREVARADLALVNGYNLEEGLLPIVVQNVAPGVPVVAAARGLAVRQGGHVHEFVEGELDRAAIDRAVADIGELAEAGSAGEMAAVEAIDAIDVIVHHLPSRSRTEAIRAIDAFIHDVPRGVLAPEEAIAGIVDITRSYQPAAGPDAALAQIASVLDEGAAEAHPDEETLETLDGLLGRISLDARDEGIREVDVAVQEWRAGALSAADALARIDAVVTGHAAEVATSETGGRVDDTVFATGDPHLWLDARNVAGYAENVRDALIAIDPAGAEVYRANAEVVIAELEALHQELLDAFAVLPVERRKLIVFHDAYRYFAAAYRFEVTASVAPGNPNQERSAAAIVEVIAAVREAGVPTIFREPQYSSESLDLIAQETGTQIGIIHSIPSADAPTYAEMMRSNAQALIDGLGGAGGG